MDRFSVGGLKLPGLILIYNMAVHLTVTWMDLQRRTYLYSYLTMDPSFCNMWPSLQLQKLYSVRLYFCVLKLIACNDCKETASTNRNSLCFTIIGYTFTRTDYFSNRRFYICISFEKEKTKNKTL